MIQSRSHTCARLSRRVASAVNCAFVLALGWACSQPDYVVVSREGSLTPDPALDPASGAGGVTNAPAAPTDGAGASAEPGAPVAVDVPSGAGSGPTDPAEVPGGDPAPIETPGAQTPPADATAPGEGNAGEGAGTGGAAPSAGGTSSCERGAAQLPALQLTEVVRGLRQPTFMAAAPGDDARLFVLERSGTIRIVRDGQLVAEPFLDLSERVATSNEQGLIGLAFHPRYAENGRFFVQYALLDPARPEGADQQVVLSELVRSGADPERADGTSERVLMVVEQPADIHLGGMLAFGPLDGMLYISRGDGGLSQSRDLDSWLGKMLRIDVDGAGGGLPYGIPAGNLSGPGVLPEIWSRGLRNPWRFGFDACTGDLYIGDVGEDTTEELNFEPAKVPGSDYGWKLTEGSACYPPGTACDPSGVAAPVMSYSHELGCAVVSGTVYRGQKIPGLRGTYLYADYCSGYFGSFSMDQGRALNARDLSEDLNPNGLAGITSFGVDNAGELYVLTFPGVLYRIDPE